MKKYAWILALCLIAPALGQKFFELKMSYDDLGRVATETYPDGSVVTYQHNSELDTPTGVTYQHSGGGTYVLVEDVAFAANGAVKTVTIPGGEQHWRYDALERLTDQWFVYHGETLFRVQKMAYNHWGGLAGFERADASVQAVFTYDYTGQEQLEAFSVGGDTASYAYDAAGNLTGVQGFNNHANGVSVQDYQLPTGATYNVRNRRSDWQYDGMGRVTRDDKLHYRYNEAGQVAMIRDRHTRIPLQTYLYDSDGNRVRTTDIRKAETTYYVRNRDGLVYSEIVDSADGHNRVVNYVFHNGVAIAKVAYAWDEPEQLTRLYRDHLGSPVVSINDQHITHHEYAPYGQQMSEPKHVGAHGYTGHEEELATGLIYMRARWQDPVASRFTTPDPARDFDPYKPATYNAYQYTHNNPINATDPTGQVIDTLWDAASAGVGIASMVNNIRKGNYKEAIIDGLGAGVDILAAAAPGIPGGVSMGIKAAREGAEVAVDVVTKVNKVDKVNDNRQVTEGVYEFTESKTDLPYVGQSGEIPRRLKEHERAGKIKPGSSVEVNEVKGGKTQREIEEHKRIRTLTEDLPASKSKKVANKKDPIGPKREHLLNEQQ